MSTFRGRTAFVITVSDRSAEGEREDLSGPRAIERLRAEGFEVQGRAVVPDEISSIVPLLRREVENGTSLVVTTGGTGCAPRDVTPEATIAVISRRVDGLSEHIRRVSLEKTPFALLSRGVCGIAGRTLIVNLPGSPRGVIESLEAILPVLPHAINQISSIPDDLH